MKDKINTCEVIQDLLPLYEDGCCSRQSRELVEEHLRECRICREKQAACRECLPGPDEQEEAEVRRIRQGIRSIVRWRTIGRALLCLILTAVFIVLPVWNQVRGAGLTYANLREAYTAYGFERALAAGDYEKAYDYLDMEYRYEELVSTDLRLDPPDPEERRDAEAVSAGIREIAEKGFPWYDEVCREAFLRNMQTLEEKNEGIRSCSDFQIERSVDRWSVSLDVRTDAGTDLILCLEIAGNRIREVSGLLKDQGSSRNIAGWEEQDEDREGKMYEVLYGMPSVNETVMEILYRDTRYDWTMLFEY